MSSSSSAVKVCVRLRPLNKREKRGNTIPVVTANTEKGEITVVKGLSTKATRHAFNFDNVFSEFATQEEVFESTLLPIVGQVMKGYEATVFAYGQTGTGKTYTMEGDISADVQRGVIPRSCESIFEQLENSGKYSKFKVTVSYLEIYNEELSDLLVETKKNLRVCEQRGKIHCMGLSEVQVNSTQEIIRILRAAQERRQVAETKMNRASSRSHCLFTLKVVSKEKVADGVIEREGKLHLVDLAGSECAKSTGESVKSARFRESQNINKSLLTLGRVITALRDRLPRIPYRDSKLTRLLQEALGGRSQTCIIATLSPSIMCVDETLSTLSYAEQAQGIKNKPVKAQVRMQANVGSSFSKGNGSNQDGTSRETFAEMEQRMLYMQAQCKEAQAALGRKHEEVTKLVARAERAEEQAESLSVKLATANKNIEEAKVQNAKICSKLRETLQDSRNKSFIIKARSETEGNLQKEGKSLIISLKQSISACKEINQKLGHAKENERKLRKATQGFYSKFVNDVNNMQEILGKFEEAQTEAANSIQTYVGQSLKDNIELIDQSTADMTEFSEKLKDTCETAASETNDYRKVSDGNTTKLQDTLKQHLQSEQVSLSEHQIEFKKILNRMVSSLEKHKGDVVSWTKNSTENAEKVENELAILVGVQNQQTNAFVDMQVSNLEELSDSHINKMENMLEKFKLQLQQRSKKEQDFLDSMTSRHNSLNLALQEHIEQLIKQDGYYNDTLAQHESLQATLSNFLSETNDKNIKHINESTAKLVAELEGEMGVISKAMDLHGKNALPKRKILNNAIDNMKSYVGNETVNQMQSLEQENNNLKHVCSANMLGSTISRADTHREQLASLKENVVHDTNEQIDILNMQQNELTQTFDYHNINGSTSTEKDHMQSISKLNKDFGQHADQQQFNFSNQHMNLTDAVSFHTESRDARQKDLTLVINSCKEAIEERTDIHKTLLEEQKKIFQASLQEHKAKQTAIISNVVQEVQRLLQQQMDEMTEQFALNVNSLSCKADSMNANADKISEVIATHANSMSTETTKWAEECSETVTKLEVVIDENSKMQDCLKNATNFVAKNIEKLQHETVNWGDCGRKVGQSLLNANNHSQNVHKSIKQNQQSVKDDVKVLTDKTTSWEENIINASEQICAVQDKISSVSESIKLQKEHVEQVAVGMLKEVTDWGNASSEFDENISHAFDQLGETKRQYTVDQDSIKEVMHKSNEAFNSRSNTLNNELHSNFEEQKASLQKAGKHLADIVKIEEENTYSDLASKFKDMHMQTKNSFTENVTGLLSTNNIASEACHQLKDQLLKHNEDNGNQIINVQHTMIDYFNNASADFVNLSTVCDTLQESLNHYKLSFQESADEHVNEGMKRMKNFESAVSDVIDEEMKTMNKFCDDRKTLMKNINSDVAALGTILQQRSMTQVEALHNLESTHKDKVCQLICTQTENLKSEQIQNLQSLEGSTTTFCLEKLSMKDEVDEVADAPSIQYSEELSQTPLDSLILQNVPLVSTDDVEEMLRKAASAQKSITESEIPPAPCTEVQPLPAPTKTPSKTPSKKWNGDINNIGENENIVPNSGKKVKRKQITVSTTGTASKMRNAKKPLARLD